MASRKTPHGRATTDGHLIEGVGWASNHSVSNTGVQFTAGRLDLLRSCHDLRPWFGARPTPFYPTPTQFSFLVALGCTTEYHPAIGQSPFPLGVQVVSTDRSLADPVRGSLAAQAVTTFGTSANALSHILHHAGSSLVVIDLRTVRDAEHFIGFLKSSDLRRIPIVAVGTPDDYKGLSPTALESLGAKFQSPLSPVEFALFTAGLPSGKSVATDSNGREDRVS